MGVFSDLIYSFLPKYAKIGRYKYFDNNIVLGHNTKVFGDTDDNTIKHGYLSNVDVFSIINKLCINAAKVPWIVEKGSDKNGWEMVDGTPLNQLLKAPNDAKEYSWFDIIKNSGIFYYSCGKTYIALLKPVGFNTVERIDVLPTANIEIEAKDDFFNPDLRYLLKLDTTERTFEQDEIVNVKWFNPLYCDKNSYNLGISPIQVAKMVVQSANDKWEADANLLQNKGAIGLVTTKSGQTLTPKEAEQIQSSFDFDIGGASKFGKVKVTSKDLSYIQMAMSSADLEIIKKGVVSTRALCNVLGVNSALFNDPENKTYNNLLEAEKAMYEDSIIPFLSEIQSGFHQKVTLKLYPKGDYRMRPDYSQVSVLHKSRKELSDMLIALVNANIITTDEARIELEYEQRSK